MQHRFLFTLSALSLATSPVMATEASTALPEVIVTAKRVAEIQPDINASTTFITREQIEQQQLRSLKDILEQQAGMSLTGNGGPLTTTSLFMRGTTSKQVLVLIDGVRVNDANQGAFDFSHIRADDIERVEIVRGPYSPQYGSDAIAGVIQIFTRKQQGVDVSLRAGRFNTFETSVNAGVGDTANGLSIGAGYLDTDGFSATNPKNVWGFNADEDGGLARSVRLSGWTTVSDDFSAKFSSSWKNSKTEIDNGVSDDEFGTASAELAHQTSDQWKQRLQLGWTRTNIDTNAPADFYFSHFLTQRDSASWVNDINWAEGMQLVAGIDYADEEAVSKDLLANTTNFDKRLQNTGIFASQYVTLRKFSGSLSVRQDKHDSFGEHTSGSVNAGYQLLPALKLFGAYGSAFRAPSANDLYYPGFFGSYAGNPDLEPERSHQSEVGMQYQWQPSHTLQASLYRNRVRDMIAAAPAAPFTMANISKANLQGAELEARGTLDRVNYSLNVSLLSAKDENGTQLPRRPRSAVNALIAYSPTDTVNAGIEWRTRSSAVDAGNKLSHYSTGNLFASWKATRELTIGARLENFNDEKYEEVYSYNTSPRAGYVSVNYSFR